MADHSFAEYIVNDVFGHISGIKYRPMFGGYGLYRDGVIFAIIVDDRLYFKADSQNLKEFEAINSEPFMYDAKGKLMKMSYYEVPEDLYTDRDEAEKWIESSCQASLRSKKK